MQQTVNTRPVGRKAASIAGAAVALIAVLSWPHLLVQYQVFRLKMEPGRLLEILDRPQDSKEGKAVRAFLETRSGKQALFDLYERLVVEPIFAAHQDVAGTLLEAIVWSGDVRASIVEWFPGRHLSSYGIPLKDTLLEHAPRIQALAESLEGEEFLTERRPGLRFHFVRAGKALEARPRLKGASILPPDGAHACLIRRDGEEEAALKSILSLLESTNNLTHQNDSLVALGDLGPRARTALPAIQKFLESGRGEEWVWATAHETTRRIAGLPAR